MTLLPRLFRLRRLPTARGYLLPEPVPLEPAICPGCGATAGVYMRTVDGLVCRPCWKAAR